MNWEDKTKEIKSPGERAWSWWSGWLALGLALSASELIVNACFGKFPVFIFLGTKPLTAIPLGMLVETLFWAALALVFGGLTELVRRIFGGAISWHLGARIGALLYLEVCVVKLLVEVNFREGLFTEVLESVDHSLASSSALILAAVLLAPPIVSFWFGRARREAGAAVVSGDELKLMLFACLLGALYPFAYNRWMSVIRWPLPSLWLGMLIIVLSIFLAGVIAHRRRWSAFRLTICLQPPALIAAIVLTVWYGWPAGHLRPNIVVSLWDTTRASLPRDERKNITPVLDTLASRGVEFVNAYSPANFTYASHVSLFTGKSYREHNLHIGFGDCVGRYRNELTLPRRLEKLGYYSALLTENNWVLSAEAGFREVRYFERMSVTYTGKNEVYPQGWCTFERPPSIYRYSNPFLGRWLLDSALYLFDGFYTHTLDRIEFRHIQELFLRSRRIGPIFLFWNLMNVHDRYHPYGTWQENSTFFDYDLQKEYNLGLRYADERLKELYGLIAKSGLLENTILIVTSDHGEFLGEYELYGHNKALFEEVIKVPLAVIHQSLEPRRVTSPVSLTNFYFLVESLAEDPEAISSERIEKTMLRRERVIAEHALLPSSGTKEKITWGYALIGSEIYYIYDPTISGLTRALAPGEEEFIFIPADGGAGRWWRVGDKPEYLEISREYCSDYEKELPAQKGRSCMKEDQQRKLRALGYLQ